MGGSARCRSAHVPRGARDQAPSHRGRPRATLPVRRCTATRWSGSTTSPVVALKTSSTIARAVNTGACWSPTHWRYFAPDERLRDLDERRARGFRRLALPPALRRRASALRSLDLKRASYRAGLPAPRGPARALLGGDVGPRWLLPRRRRGRAVRARRAALHDARATCGAPGRDPSGSRPLFELLASTGLRSPRRSPCGSGCRAGRRCALRSTCAARSSTAAHRPEVPARPSVNPDQPGVGSSIASARRGSRRGRAGPSSAPGCALAGRQSALPRARSRPLNAPAFRGRAFTRCATPARRCSSKPAPARAPPALDGTPLRRVHPRYLRPPLAGRVRPVAGVERSAGRTGPPLSVIRVRSRGSSRRAGAWRTCVAGPGRRGRRSR